MIKNILIIMGISLLWAGIAEPDINTTRARGMYNAFVGLSNDGGALYYNPAGLQYVDAEYYNKLTRVDKLLEESTRGHVYGGADYLGNLGFSQLISYIGSGKPITSVEMIKLNTGLDKNAYNKKAISVSLYSESTGFAFNAIENLEYKFYSSYFEVKKDKKLVASIGKSFELGSISVGISGHGVLLSREYSKPTYTAVASANIKDYGMFEQYVFADSCNPSILNGAGLAANIGMMTELNNFRVGVAMENFIASDISLSPIKGTATQNLKADEDWAIKNLMAGISYSDGDLVFDMDVHNLNRKAKEVTYHIGIEKDLLSFWVFPTLRVRLGGSFSQLYSGYATGVAFKLWIFQTNISYMEKILNVDQFADTILTEAKDQQLNLNVEMSF